MQVGLQNNLPIMAPVDNAGVFTEEAGPFQGALVSQLHHSVPVWNLPGALSAAVKAAKAT